MIWPYHLQDRPRRNVIVQTDHGSMIVNRFDCNWERVGQGQWLMDHGCVSTVEAGYCITALKDRADPVIFDIGANIGTFATWMARTYLQGQIYAFEPQRSVFQILAGNMAINNFYNVWCYPCAMGDSNSSIEIQEPDYFDNQDYGVFSLVQDKIVKKSQYRTVVDVVSLDWFVDHHHIPRVDLLKIDAEGMDVAVLRGAMGTIKSQKPVIFIEHCDNQRSIQDEIQEFLRPWGYRFTLQGNNILAVA